MNDDKTEFLIIGTRQQLEKVNLNCISIGTVDISPSNSPIKSSALWLDRNLSMDTHITRTCSTAFYYLYNIRRIRPYLSRRTTEILVHAFITSRLDYCNSLFYGIPSYQLHKLQRIQNAAAPQRPRESKFCHITPLLRLLHWLPVKQRIQFMILLLNFRAIHGSSPQYIMDLITFKEPTRYCLRSQNSITLMRPRGKYLATLGDSSFCAAAPKVWNSLPAEIRSLDVLTCLNHQLRLLFLTNIFYTSIY
jgi:hypothetical protein